MLKNTIDLKIKGKNIDRMIKRLYKHNIEILNINYIKYNEIIVRINKEDLELMNNLKTIYEIDVVGINGIDKLKQLIYKNIYLISSILISSVLLIILSNTIFSVDIIHNNPELRKLITKELENYNISKYHFKKSYKDIQIIKKNILNKYKNDIEWLEIINSGTKYIVRVEERKINKERETFKNRNIVALKDARIIKIDATNGEIVKNKNDYVHKGDIIITGDIKLYEESKNIKSAIGTVYGEVWYKTTIEYPLTYDEKVLTGKTKKVFSVKIFNKYYDIFNFKKYTTCIRKDKILLKHNFLPISFVYQKQYETNEIHKKLNKKQAIKEAINITKQQINQKLSKNEYIIDVKKLKVSQNNSKIVLELFVSVCEDITDYANVEEN